MKLLCICAALLTIVASCGAAARAAPGSATAASAAADRLFRGGKFAEAGTAYARIVELDPKAYSASLMLGRIALLSNRLDAAQKWLQQALALRPGDSDAKVMLAEVFYRRDDFQRAAAALAGIDASRANLIRSQYPTLNVRKMRSFKGQTPYELQGSGETAHLKFVRTDPLPLVRVRVNGGAEVVFFIDTGGSEVALDTEFARKLGVPEFGAVEGTFSGGERTRIEQGRIASLTLGDWTIKNLPAVMLPLRQLSRGLGVKRIDGCIGTTLFYHFLATIDYRQGELVLRRKTAHPQPAAAGVLAAVPFWIAGDHFMVGWGRVETLPPALLFIDTGLAGAAVKLARSVIAQAGIELEDNKAYAGMGGAGRLKIVPYVVRELAFGDVKEDDVSGLYDGPFPWEYTYGFFLAGMIGHDFFRRYALTFDFGNMQIYLQ